MSGRSSNAKGFQGRTRWASPRQVELLDSLWSARLRRAKRRLRPARSREECLRHFAKVVGRPVESCRDLTWREANRVIERLLEEVRVQGSRPSRALAKTPKGRRARPS